LFLPTQNENGSVRPREFFVLGGCLKYPQALKDIAENAVSELGTQKQSSEFWYEFPCIVCDAVVSLTSVGLNVLSFQTRKLD
jgi:hypothetical protein